jgi:hypothetical protein
MLHVRIPRLGESRVRDRWRPPVLGRVRLGAEVGCRVSGIQMVTEHYYDILFGRYDRSVVRELRRFVSDERVLVVALKTPELFLSTEPEV